MFHINTQSALHNHVNQRETSAPTLSPRAEEIISAPTDVGYSGAVIAGIAQIFETILTTSIGFAIYWIYVGPGSENLYLPIILASCLLANLLFNIAQTHRLRAYRTPVWQIARVLAVWSGVIALLAIGLFFFKIGGGG